MCAEAHRAAEDAFEFLLIGEFADEWVLYLRMKMKMRKMRKMRKKHNCIVFVL